MRTETGTLTFDEVAERARGVLFETLLDQLERLHWDTDRLAAHRQAALTDQLVFAAERSPWHGTRLGGIDLARVTPDDLTALPTMTKADLMAHWDRIVTDPRLDLSGARGHLRRLDTDGPSFLLDEYLVFTTGGSSGAPGVFPWSIEEFSRWAATNIRIGADHGDPPPERLTFVGARSPRHASALPPLLLHGLELGSRRVVPVDQPVPQIVAALNAARPDSIWSVASMLPALAAAKAEGTLRIDPHRIAVGGDAVDPSALDAAERAFGVRPIETYPTTDVGHIAVQPPDEEGMVVSDDLLVVEAVDEHDRPVPVGEISHHLLVTSLHHRTLPLIRYRLDDRVRFAPPSGRYGAFSRIAEIDGRVDDSFRYGAVTVHPHTFRTVLSRSPEVAGYQVSQTEHGASVAIVGAEALDLDGLRDELVAALAAAGLPDAEVTMAAVADLPRSAVGKRRNFIASGA